MFKKTCNLIFDFDGTIADSFHTALNKLILLSKEFNFREIESSEIESIKHLTSKEVINYIEIPFYKLPHIIHRAREYMKHEIVSVPTFSDLPETLAKLKHLNCNLGILTSNSLQNVMSWLEHHEMHNIFDFIYAGSSFFGKKHLLKKMMNSHSMDLSSTFYIGDETRDIEAAKKCSVKSIAVTWGFNSEKVLILHHPTFIVKNPTQIITIVEEYCDSLLHEITL